MVCLGTLLKGIGVAWEETVAFLGPRNPQAYASVTECLQSLLSLVRHHS